MTLILVMLLAAGGFALWQRINLLQRKLTQMERSREAFLRKPAVLPGDVPAAPEAPVAASAKKSEHLHSPEPEAPYPGSRSVAHELPAQRVASDTESTLPPRSAWNPPPDESVQASRAPSLDERIVRAVTGYFTGGNLVVRVGVIVLFFGVAFLLKYAADHTHVPIQVRLLGVALGAAGLFVLGWRLRTRRRGFALALQGGAIGVIYLTLFAALRLYQLLPPSLTFALMAALGVSSCLLAVRQDSMAFSMLGVTGGFLAPILASTGQGSHVVLFGYYALLDVFIVAQAWFKAWRALNLLAFVFTFGVGTVWGVTRYVPYQFASTEPFLLFFFLAFVAVAILFAFRRAPQLRHYVDGTLVFGTPVVAMALQMQLVRELHHGRAISALAVGLVYLGLAAWLYRTRRETLRLLMESFIALGIAFLTLAVPLWLDDAWTAATWALEGAALVWMGLRQERRLATASGVVLQVAAAVAFLGQMGGAVVLRPLANAQFVGAVLLSAAGLLSARCAQRASAILAPMGQIPSHLFLAWGLGWWLLAGQQEVQAFVPQALREGALLAWFAATALACGAGVRPLSWPALRAPALLILPTLWLATFMWLSRGLHPVAAGGWFAWPLGLAAVWVGLWWHESSLPARLAGRLHGWTVWLLALLLSWELHWQVQQVTAPGTVWAAAAWALPPILLLAALTSRLVERWWPLRAAQAESRGWVALGLGAVLGVWLLWINVSSDGLASPLPFVPILNPLDIAVILALWAAGRWLMKVWQGGTDLFRREQQRMLVGVLVGLTFCWLNAVLLRTLHYWNGVPYRPADLAANTVVQAALSIFWTVLALGAMLWANRSRQRVVWFGAAALMAVVVAKLFLVDLARIGTVARIVSFLGVGGLMLVIGYYSPLPPTASRDDPDAGRG